MIDFKMVSLWLFLWLLLAGNHVVKCEKEPWLFLFAGQSNMIGHSNDKSSVTNDSRLQTILFNNFLHHQDGDFPDSPDALANRLLAFYDRYLNDTQYNHTFYAEHQAQELYDLVYTDQLLGVPSKLKESHPTAECYFLNPDHEVRGTDSKFVPLQPDAGCGSSFGHELAFAHAMTTSGAIPPDQPFKIIKVAVGGTELYKDWSHGHGTYWMDLRDTIRSQKGHGKFVGFVWHQGENDCFTAMKSDGQEDTTLTYKTNLTAFTAAVRKEIHKANTHGAKTRNGNGDGWKTIPLAIMSLHAWPKSQYRNRVELAQAEFVNHDNVDGEHSVFVPIQDLGPHYHLDAAGLLISGTRLASHFAPLLNNLGTTAPTVASTNPPGQEEEETNLGTTAPTVASTNPPGQEEEETNLVTTAPTVASANPPGQEEEEKETNLGTTAPTVASTNPPVEEVEDKEEETNNNENEDQNEDEEKEKQEQANDDTIEDEETQFTTNGILEDLNDSTVPVGLVAVLVALLLCCGGLLTRRCCSKSYGAIQFADTFSGQESVPFEDDDVSYDDYDDKEDDEEDDEEFAEEDFFDEEDGKEYA